MKKVFISGIGGGIGSALYKRYSAQGYTVIGQYNKHKPTWDIETIQADFTDREQVVKTAMYLQENHPDLDIVVNNAGMDGYGLFTDTTEKLIDDLISVNLTAPMIVAKYVGRNMLSRKKGCILNVSSIWGREGGSCETVYSAAKGGLISFTKALAKEWGLSGVRVNALCPGFIDTPMNDGFSEEDKKAFCEGVALGRIGTPEEVARAAFFLTSDEASYITGQIISVDGGM